MQSVQNNQVLHDSANDYRIQQGQVLREQVMANNLSQNQQAIKRKPNLQVNNPILSISKHCVRQARRLGGSTVGYSNKGCAKIDF